ncbi:tannase/feruloyl esterase family alpha/beta hydrolase [Marinomonas pollencensis]|uniref:Feruloyl esterase n=1 Tax=Marinomonas pollencensis TaxID=491954 RepID=A0A3E0DLX4_9GAMM|nr:tannase/feruloyl esterase family alpha/beta hydrolase [Marinomonas pollencensis]REG83808.1 feruloyl esterase [Marinomonas pollencensis]
MNALLLPFLLLSLLLASSLSHATACSDLAATAPQGIQLATQRYLADGQSLTSYCLVRGKTDQRVGTDGKIYQLKFELRLPDYWQGRFAYQFNSGNGGSVKPAVGKVTGLLPQQYAVNRGFAVLSSNGGHDAEPVSVAGLTSSVLFARDPQARRDYSYDAVRKLYPVARALIQNYYRAPIRYSYGIGEGNGGRMAIVAASRFPHMFDGLLAAAPGLHLPQSALQYAWDAQILHSLEMNKLTKRDLALFAKSVLDQCDGLDGINDDLIFAADACQRTFQASQLVCHSDFDRYCLASEKVAAITRMQQGPSNRQGMSLYTDWVYDTGIGSVNWQRWKVQSAVSVWQDKPASSVLGAAALANLYMTPPVDVGATAASLENFLLGFDFDQDALNIYASSRRYPESALDLMEPPNVASPRLSAFQKNGGKMLVFHGNSDPVFSVNATIDWYQKLTVNQQGLADSFVRLYRVPGLPHGDGGMSLGRFDTLLPLMQWVEKNQVPERIMATAGIHNPEVTNRMMALQRPLCPYPRTAIYRQGDVRLASSFACLEAP